MKERCEPLVAERQTERERERQTEREREREREREGKCSHNIPIKLVLS